MNDPRALRCDAIPITGFVVRGFKPEGAYGEVQIVSTPP